MYAWALFSACVLGSTHPWSVPGILDVGRDGAASWPRAITSGQNKKRPSQRQPKFGFCHGSGAGHCGRGLRRFDIHECLLPAALALSGQVSGGGVRPDQQQLSLAAYRADDPSVPYDKFTTSYIRLQTFSPHFCVICKKIYLTPRPKRIEKLFFLPSPPATSGPLVPVSFWQHILDPGKFPVPIDHRSLPGQGLRFGRCCQCHAVWHCLRLSLRPS